MGFGLVHVYVSAFQTNIPAFSIFNFVYILAYFVVKFHSHQFRRSNTSCVHIDDDDDNDDAAAQKIAFQRANWNENYDIWLVIENWEWKWERENWQSEGGSSREMVKSKFHGSMRFIDITLFVLLLL